MNRLKDKVAIVTAGGSGIGKASAILFAQEGAKVLVNDIDQVKGEYTVKIIKNAGGEAVFYKADVSIVADMARMIKTAVDNYGKLNILFNNAGMPGPYQMDITEEAYQRCLDVNNKGAIFATKFAVPEMRKVGGGSIIFTASTAGLFGTINSPVYAMAKGGIVNLTRSLALVLANDNIRVNCVCPTLVDTPMAPGFMPPGNEEEKKAKMKMFTTQIPLGGGRMAKSEEVGQAVLFLASDEASFITGSALAVDGGFCAK